MRSAPYTASIESMPHTSQVWFVVFPKSELLDLVGPWAVLGYANEVMQCEAYSPQLVSVSPGSVRSRHGLVLSGARSLEIAGRGDAPHTLVVAGGAPVNPLPAAETAAAHWLRKNSRRVPRIVSICSGAFVLAEAGLLDKRKATTHWQFVSEFRKRFPHVHVNDDAIFLNDGPIWTSAGITAGIDLMLALVEQDHGHDVSMLVAKNLVLFLRRTGKQAQFSQALKWQEREPARLRDLSAFILANLDRNLPVGRLAEEVAMSARSLTRWCESELQESPASLVRRIRFEEAQRLLEQTTLPLKTVAARTHIGDLSTLWRLFTSQLGVTPAEYRQRFAALPPPASKTRRKSAAHRSVAGTKRQRLPT